MIQRKQTLYLLAAVIVLVLTMAFPIGKFLVDDKEFVITTLNISETGVETSLGSLPLVILVIASALLPFVTIFLYKRRMLQMRLCFAEFVLLIGLQGFIIWALLFTKDAMAAYGNVTVAYSVVAAMPLVAMVLTWLALRGIIKDEALVRSMNRIR